MQNRILYEPPVVPMEHMGGTIPSGIDSSVKPGTNFYKYVNKKWQRHVHMPAYTGSFGVSEEIEQEVQESLLDVLTKLEKTKPSHPISKLVSSFLHTSAQVNSIVDLQRIISGFHCIKDSAGLASTIGALNKIQARAPLSLVIASDSYNSSKCSIYLYEPYLGLPEKFFYKEGAKNRIFQKYVKLLQELSKKLHIDSLDVAVDVELAILPYLSNNGELGEINDYYNSYTFHELEKAYPNISWAHMMESWGVTEKVYHKAPFIVTNPKFMTKLNNMFLKTPVEVWQAWMSAMTVLTYLEYLPPPYDDLHFELYGRTLRGNTQKLPQKYLTLKVLKTYTTQDLGRIFVEHGVPNGTKTYATRLVHKLKDATIERLKAIEWMTPSTRRTAIHKVRAMKFQVAHPDHWESETADVMMDPERPLLNIITLASADNAKMIEDLVHGCKKTPETWDDGQFEVNAFYYSEGNMMVVPAGILRAPFFDLKRSMAWNYGGIGSAIGHEITHGFDEEGRFYDEKGNYNNWWSDHDSRMFTKLTRAILNLFDGVESVGGKVNGDLTLSENIADLGGVAIALQALKTELPADAGKRKQAYKDFFTSYAVSWRTKDRPKKAKQALFLDVHAPPHLRVNLIVRQFAEFYEAFDIGADDAGWIAPEHRIQLW